MCYPYQNIQNKKLSHGGGEAFGERGEWEVGWREGGILSLSSEQYGYFHNVFLIALFVDLYEAGQKTTDGIFFLVGTRRVVLHPILFCPQQQTAKNVLFFPTNFSFYVIF